MLIKRGGDQERRRLSKRQSSGKYIGKKLKIGSRKAKSSKLFMEECRFEKSELQASFMTATPLWYDSWSLCEVADRTRSIQIHHIAGIVYVALPAVEITQPDNLVVLKVAGDGSFSALSTSLPSNEPPPMVNGAIRDLFVSSSLHIQSQITQGLEMEERKQVVITGHSTGGAVAALTALWLLSQPSKPSFRLLCITFGCPLLGNQSLSSSISRSRLAHNFCNVVSIHDLAPRRNDDLWPFGTFLFCSDIGCVCLDNADSVRKMFFILNSTGTPNIEERPRYEHYVSTLSHQFLVSRSFSGGSLSDNSYQAGVALAVESLGFSRDNPSGVSAKECIEAATEITRAPIVRSSELAIELGNVLPSRLEIQWFKDNCDGSPKQLGYYDNFKVMSKREMKVNVSRTKLAKFWDGVIRMLEKNELPSDFHLGKKWVYASQFYQLLAEPLDIAYFYKYDYSRTKGHYMENGNRPKRYVEIDKWWKVKGEPHKEKGARTRYASTTLDTCFWAKLEEAKECLDDMKSESIDEQRRYLLWKRIVGFESYAETLVKMKEVSVDVLARNSSYSVWVERLSEFKIKKGNMVADDAMEF